MCTTARLFNCQLCHAQTWICSVCDRGNQYCSPDCSRRARRNSLNRANQKYRQTRQGKPNNALRQRRHRQRQSEKVTDQGSLSEPAAVSFNRSVRAPVIRSLFPLIKGAWCALCHFCYRQIADFVRTDFLHRSFQYRRR